MLLSSRAIVCLGGGALLMSIVSAQAPETRASVLPDGPGKAALVKACSDCHGAESAVGQLKTRDEWSKTLDEMAANGAQATDEEWNQILDYLEKYFSLILVNKADARQLARTLDVSQAEGEAIVGYRDEHGRFIAIDDLKKVPGLDAAKVEARKDRFVF
jgi:competence protein ComEA